MAEYDEPAPEGSSASASADGAGRSPPAKRADGRSPLHHAQPHRERSLKSRDRGRQHDEYEDRERYSPQAPRDRQREVHGQGERP